MKQLISTGILLILLLINIGCGTSSEVTPAPSIPTSTTPAPATTPAPMVSVNRIDLIYFHPEIRCALCLSLEMQTINFLENRYKTQMDNGQITFTSYEIEDKNNKAILNKYGAIGSQLFVNTIVNGKENIQHIEKIWLPQIYNDATAFDRFMTGVINESLEAIRNG